MEYVLITIFSLLLSLSAIQLIKNILKSHADEIQEKLGVELNLPTIFDSSDQTR